MQQPKEFASLAEAKDCMKAALTSLNDDETKKQLIAAVTPCEGDQQKIIAGVMPIVQKVLSAELVKFGFPPGPMGILMSVPAFKKWEVVDGNPTPVGDALEFLKAAAGMPTPGNPKFPLMADMVKDDNKILNETVDKLLAALAGA